MKTKELETIKGLADCIRVYTEARTIQNILVRESCRESIIRHEFVKKYGFNKYGLLASIVQNFYEKGKEDAKKELKEQL